MNFFADDGAEIVCFFFFITFLQIHHQVFNSVRVGNVLEDEALFFCGGLNIEIAIVEKSGDDTLDFDRDVLDIFQLQFADAAGEKTFLLDVDNPFIGDDPNVKIVVNPNDEKKQPNKNKKNIFQKEKKA